MKKNKKSQAHLEFILSFVIFIGFLLVLITLLNPFKITEKKEIYLDELQRGIASFTSSDVQIISILLDENPNKCFYFDYNGEKVIVFDKNLEQIPAYSSGGKIYIDGRDKFYYIYSSPNFIEDIFSENCKSETNLNYGLHREYNISFMDNMNNLEQEYNSNYNQLKQELGLPDSKDFLFSLKNTTNDILIQVSRNLPSGLQISSKDVSMEVIDSHGKIDYDILNIRVW